MLRISVDVDAPAERVWALVGDLERWVEILPTVTAVRRLSPAAEGRGEAGARFEVRQPGLPRAVYEVTAWEPGRSFIWVARSPGVVTTAGHTVVPDGDTARLDLALDWSGPLAAPVRLAFGRKARRMVEIEAATFAALATRG